MLVEHSLASIKRARQSNTALKPSTFHLDAAKLQTRTDPPYLESVHSSISNVRQRYALINVRSKRASTITSLQTLLEDTTQIRMNLNKKLLSRQRYIKLRRHIGITHTRLQRLIEKITVRNETSKQTTMTQYLRTATYTSVIERDSPTLDSDPSEDYRGESD